MKHILIALLLTGCAGNAPVPVSEAPPNRGAFGAIVTFDPSVPTRWVQDHQDQFGFGGVKSIEHVSLTHADGIDPSVPSVNYRLYDVLTRSRGLLHIMTTESQNGGERIVQVFTGGIPTDDLMFICGEEGADTC